LIEEGDFLGGEKEKREPKGRYTKRMLASEKKNDFTPQLPSVGKVARKDPLFWEIEGYSACI
jgi:hypothetical protein